jgi:hypothetical protein
MFHVEHSTNGVTVIKMKKQDKKNKPKTKSTKKE